jgi:RHS repeat-associated protein
LQSGGVLDPAVTSFLNRQGYNAGRPKAFLNWILLDEQLKYAGGGFEQVGDNEVFSTHIRNGLPVSKNGYLYVYVSNETPNITVFFDNLQLTHSRGPLVEETHYYPFGLIMQGISSRAANGLGSRYKFNLGTELNNDLGLDLYETLYRNYDSQIGRFNQIDPITDISENWSPYVFVQNNPLLYNDPLGLDTAINHSNPRILNPATVFTTTNKNKVTLNSNSNFLMYLTSLVGSVEFSYGVSYLNYDHKNYITTKGKMKPFPVDVRRMSAQAKKAKINSANIKGVGFGISMTSTLLTFVQIRDQYLGGREAINSLDVTGFTLGTVGITADILKYFRVAPTTLAAVSEVTGVGGIILGTFQMWMTTFGIMYNTNLPLNKYSGDAQAKFEAAMDEQIKGEWKNDY